MKNSNRYSVYSIKKNSRQMTQQQTQEFLNFITNLIGVEHSDKVSEVSEILTQYINHSLSSEEASERFNSLFGTNEILQKFDEILKRIKTTPDPTIYQSNSNNPNLLNIPSPSSSNLQPQVPAPAQNNPPSIQPPLQPPFFNQKIAPISGYRKKARPWTPEEDQRLINAINANGTENWPLVTSLVGGDRTRSQCSQRWHRVLNPKISKSNWSREEEQKLLNAVQEYGNKAWTRIATEMGNRSDVQCRFRYKFLVKKAKENDTELVPISASQDTLNQVSQSGNMGLGQYNNISPSSIQEDQIQLSDQIKLADPSQVPINFSLIVQDNQKDGSHAVNVKDEEHSHDQNDEGQNGNTNEGNQS